MFGHEEKQSRVIANTCTSLLLGCEHELHPRSIESWRKCKRCESYRSLGAMRFPASCIRLTLHGWMLDKAFKYRGMIGSQLTARP